MLPVKAAPGRWVLISGLGTAIRDTCTRSVTGGAAPLVAGTLLVLDSVLVGFVALVLGSAGWMIYRIRLLDALT